MDELKNDNLTPVDDDSEMPGMIVGQNNQESEIGQKAQRALDRMLAPDENNPDSNFGQFSPGESKVLDLVQDLAKEQAEKYGKPKPVGEEKGQSVPVSEINEHFGKNALGTDDDEVAIAYSYFHLFAHDMLNQSVAAGVDPEDVIKAALVQGCRFGLEYQRRHGGE